MVYIARQAWFFVGELKARRGPLKARRGEIRARRGELKARRGPLTIEPVPIRITQTFTTKPSIAVAAKSMRGIGNYILVPLSKVREIHG
jgi:hypothetical protein